MAVVPHPPLRKYYEAPEKREHFVRDLFDDTAPWYDWSVAFLSFGSGGRYRREALARAGLTRGQRVLDIATGTGVVARAGLTITGSTSDIIGMDPSIGMLMAGREKEHFPLVEAGSEHLPFRDASFDMITIGFALRHFADLDAVFRDCRRVLRPGGRILIMEITAPASRAARTFLGAYMGGFVPLLATVITRSRKVGQMLAYYWATTRDCVRPEVILEALRGAGFGDARRHVELGMFSEYTALSSE
jgi:demethylmenaquinone methyltransferase/2-methoxy-6-polyprenyl-1,4-benzoquinol methylase